MLLWNLTCNTIIEIKPLTDFGVYDTSCRRLKIPLYVMKRENLNRCCLVNSVALFIC